MNRKWSIGLGALAVVGVATVVLGFRCRHKFSRPFTWKKGKLKIHYVVCLECGKEYLYDLDTSKVGAETRVDNHDIVGNKAVV